MSFAQATRTLVVLSLCVSLSSTQDVVTSPQATSPTMPSPVVEIETTQEATKANDDVTTQPGFETTAAEVTSQVPAPDDSLCIKAYGTCLTKDEGEKCADDHAAVPGICGKPQLICCVPSQKEESTWFQSDGSCTLAYGVCQIDSTPCNGVYDQAQCGGPDIRMCCSPNAEEVSSWSAGDEPCQQALGVCQHGSNPCQGTYQTGTCGGPTLRRCCLPSVSQQQTWRTLDEGCDEKWGVCQADHSPCDGGSYVTGLCGGPEVRQCCAPSDVTVSGWSSLEATCMTSFGECVHAGIHCNGTKSSTMCQGPAYRVCCELGESVVASWQEYDVECKTSRGVCQHTSSPCDGVFDTSKACGGPPERKCCVAPATAPPKTVPKAGSDNTSKGRSRSTILLVTSGLLLAVSLALLLLFLWKRGCFSRTYKRVKDDNWYMRSQNETDESVNLTSCDDRVNYA